MKIVNKKISDLKVSEYNPRKISEEGLEQLKKSLSTFGIVEPAVINIDPKRKNVVIGGHQRIRAAKDLGLKVFPCYEVSLSLKKERELNVRLNKNAGDWDFGILADNFNVTELLQWGFTEQELDVAGLINPTEIVEDEVPEPPSKPRTVTGDIYEIGGHRLLCGDAAESDDVAKLMNGKKADMLFIDPPYGINYRDVKHHHNEGIKNDGNSADAAQNIESSLAFYSGIPIYVCCNWQSLNVIRNAMETAGFPVKACIVWDKQTRIQNLDKFAKQHEFILYSGVFGGEKTVSGDVWRCSRETRQDHPTAKPVELVGLALGFSSSINGVVVDLFAGSGTTVVAAQQLGRTCYAMEIEPKYCDVTISRWVNFTGAESVKLNGKEIKWPTQH